MQIYIAIFTEITVSLVIMNYAKDAIQIFDAENDRLELAETPTATPPSVAFATTEDFEAYFTAGVRSYGPGREPNTAPIVDLHKRSDNHFEPMKQLAGTLATADGAWRVDSVYRTLNGRYEWRYEGDVAY